MLGPGGRTFVTPLRYTNCSLMKGRHAQKNFGAVGAMAQTPLSFKTPGGGGGLGGLGGVAYKDRAQPPPRVWYRIRRWQHKNTQFGKSKKLRGSPWTSCGQYCRLHGTRAHLWERGGGYGVRGTAEWHSGAVRKGGEWGGGGGPKSVCTKNGPTRFSRR